MFSGFFGKGDKAGKTSKGGEGKPRGIEVIEDDPDTAWGLWDSALAAQDSSFEAPPPEESDVPVADVHTVPMPLPMPMASVVPTLDFDGTDVHTQPMVFAEDTLEQRKDDALRIVERHHERIANTIRSLWGYKECSEYINKLIMSGADGMGHARAGFNQTAVESMLVLADIHDKLFPSELDASLDFSDTKRAGGWGKLR